MPPCLDVYAWLPEHSPAVLQRFIDRYVDEADPGDDRLGGFTRTYVRGEPQPDDAHALADLKRDPCDPTGAFSLYVQAREHYGAIITITSEGDTVLGLRVDDPLNDPDALAAARSLLERLLREFASPAGLLGAELPPPQSRREWDEDTTLHRVGQLP